MASEAVLRSKDDLIERQRAIAPRAKLNDMVPLQRTTLHEQVVNRIRDLIIDGTLLSGSRIVEAELGAQLGVSRTPLREAFKTLAGEGLIDLQPTRGAFIHKSTADEAQQMLEVLTGLEAFAGRLACQRATDAEIGELRRKQDRMATFFANHRRMDYYKINIEIHTGFVALAHNAELAALHANYAGRVKRIRFSGSSTRDKWAEALHEHEQMMRALEDRDPDRLADVMRRHMGLIWERVRDTL